jgi:CDP-diacylglycerol--serine O-phosphatidyltransferase
MVKNNIPNFITLLNLFLGCCALASVFYGQFMQAFFFSLASGAADYLDGTVARVMKTKSAIGQQLDSLADMVSFGVVPGAILYMLLVKGYAGADVLPIELTLAAAPAFVVSMFAAIRLAKFNIDENQTENFSGMPTPVVAIFTVGLMLIYHYDSYGLSSFVTNPYFLYCCIIALSGLMIARIPMFSMKFRNLKWGQNQVRFIFLALSVLLIILFKEAAPALIVIIYVLFTFFDYFIIRPGDEKAV